MKKLIMITFLMTIMLGCKDQEKKQDTLIEPNMEEVAMEPKDDKSDILKLGCYEYITEDNNVKMEVTRIEGDAVNAKLLYAYAEKDRNEGTFSGNLHGDILIGTYTFMSEGKQSVRDVAFKVEKDQIVEGFGNLDEGGTKFKDTTQLTYSSKTPWKKVACN